MITVDANLLIHCVNRDAPQHSVAQAWWDEVLNGPETVGLASVAVLAFLRIATRPGVFKEPLPVDLACDLAEEWLEQPNVIVLDAGSEHLRQMMGLLRVCGTGGNLTTDTFLAALAIEYGAELQTLDRDFARFPGLRWRNPLD